MAIFEITSKNKSSNTAPAPGGLNSSQSETERAEPEHIPLNPQPDFPRTGAALSFETGLSRQQNRLLKFCAVTFGIASISYPALALFSLAWSLFAVFSVVVFWRGLLTFIALCTRLSGNPRPHFPALIEDWPTYTLLVPLYREAAVIPQLAGALSQLHWPADRLDVQILLEADDPETIRAAEKAAFPPNTRLILVPPGGPRTKPNALNLGLSKARGQYIAVYDAEDRPHPAQLRAAHHAFSKGLDNMACVQAPLVARMNRGSWIATHWALEYAVQFGLILPSMALYRLPILIGGTSNHFRKSALQALGGWDSYNVTEDADLGMRMARAGLVCGTIAPPTYEEAPQHLNIWLAQRTRWIKGFIQTWLVLMRTPGKTARQMGALRFGVMQVTLGGAILTPVAHLPCLLLVALIFAFSDLTLGIYGAALLITALAVNFAADLLAPGVWTWRRWVAALTRPIYWPLHSIAAYRAIWELAKAPFFWAKTPHRPSEIEEIKPCSTGLSASAWPPSSSPWESLRMASSAPSGNLISDPTNGRGD